MVHDLLLPITGTPGDANAVSAAVALASSTGAHLAVIQSVELPLPMPGPWGIAPDIMLDQIHAELRAEAVSRAGELRSRLEKEGISFEVRIGESRFVEPPQTVAVHARYADLAIITAPRPGADDGALARRFFTSLLFESGRPVLVIPPHHPAQFPVRHAVVAWQPTREATRALHDALPLLASAASIDVLTVDPEVGENKHGEDPGIDIATHLARHGLSVSVINRPRNGETVATALLRHSAESGAQLLVAGGYGHSRIRQWMLGGTTRELLQAIHLPILFSH